jgi:subtilisin-like proprotein convertase family protein
MTARSRGVRLLAAPLAALLVAVGLASVAVPADGARTTFANIDGVAIADPVGQVQNADIDIDDESVAAEYPSTIEIAESGEITDVNVTLNNVDHGAPDDVDILLVGPTGAQATIMSDAGGMSALADVDVVLDDQALTALPDATTISHGVSYRPGNHEGTDDFPAPAPSDTGDSALSVFNGTEAAGTWSLFVVDDNPGQAGLIDGWVLDIRVKSDPYPSAVGVSGIGAYLTDVDLSLTGLTHEFASDVDVLLVGPDGDYATVLSDVGGTGAVNDVDLLLDDEAPTSLPAAVNLTPGSFRPANNGVSDAFPASGTTPSGASALSAFDGSDPNGTWSLYVVDDADNDQGSLGGWSLDIETDDTPPVGMATVNGGRSTTTSRAVTVDLDADDPGPASSGVTAVRLSNDGVTFGSPLPYAASVPWTLSTGDGTKRVWVRFVDAGGLESDAVSDTIRLDTVPPRATRTNPANRARAVKTTAKLRIVASEKLRPASVSRATVVLRAPSGKVAARVTYAAATTTITVVPKAPLRHRVTYTLTVSRVKDLAGLVWDQKPRAGKQPLQLVFTTA